MKRKRNLVNEKRRDLERHFGFAKGSMREVSDEFINEAYYKIFQHGDLREV